MISDYLTDANRNSFEERFWSKLQKASSNECWIWCGAISEDKYVQYGKIGLPLHPTLPRCVGRAHRVAYFLTDGDIPDGMVVMHRCDNPPCCNPNHLMTGTHAENMRDMSLKMRSRNGLQIGQENGNAVLTEADVVNIWNRINSGESNTNIGNDYGVSHSTISSIKRGKSWANITMTL